MMRLNLLMHKKKLNYSEFAKYRIRKQYIKFEETEELVKENVMPLPSYTWIHKNAILTDRQKRALIEWSSSIRDSLKTKYPADSFLKR